MVVVGNIRACNSYKLCSVRQVNGAGITLTWLNCIGLGRRYNANRLAHQATGFAAVIHGVQHIVKLRVYKKADVVITVCLSIRPSVYLAGYGHTVVVRYQAVAMVNVAP